MAEYFMYCPFFEPQDLQKKIRRLQSEIYSEVP